MLMPARVAMALQADGWWLRAEIVWSKPNPMPESVRDRPTAAHEKVFLLSTAKSYFYDAEAVRVANAAPALGAPSHYTKGTRSTACGMQGAWKLPRFVARLSPDTAGLR